MSRVKLQVPAINPKRGLDRNILLAKEGELPNAVVLLHRKSTQRSIEGPASAGDELLISQTLQMQKPYLRHLVHCD
jgi:hypothetical protein